MQFLTTINNAKCLEWGINGTQGALFSLLYEINAWAKEEIIDNKVYYFISRNKILYEMPLYYEKTDTIYRHLKVLKEKGIIEYVKNGKMDLIRITEKGKTWNFLKSEDNSEKNPTFEENSEKNPSKFGKKSEKNSEINPTNQDTILNQDTNTSSKEKINKKEKVEIESVYKSKEFKETFNEFIVMRKSIKKPATEKAIKLLLSKLEKIKDEAKAIEILEKSIVNNWQDVYGLKEGGTGGSKKYKTSFGRTNDKHNEKTDRSKDGEGWN